MLQMLEPMILLLFPVLGANSEKTVSHGLPDIHLNEVYSHHHHHSMKAPYKAYHHPSPPPAAATPSYPSPYHYRIVPHEPYKHLDSPSPNTGYLPNTPPHHESHPVIVKTPHPPAPYNYDDGNSVSEKKSGLSSFFPSD